jgi:glycosyltransferase involved in cell wall biosynthesis
VYQPLVSVICLCYNHEKYVARAIASVIEQTYANIELIVIDDASPDGSMAIIKKLSEIHHFTTIFNSQNQGNCKSFNTGFRLSKGKYVIDLAADDVLLPERVKIGVEALEKKGGDYGVHFSDIELLDASGHTRGTHFKRDLAGNLLEKVAEGDLYKLLLEKYYISTPTMMMRRTVLEQLNGYDEDLSYEDFDFWIRSARHIKYCFSDRVLMQKQILSGSNSSKQYQRKNPHCLSTAMVCQKALILNKTPEENSALLQRINYELRWALITENWEAASLFLRIKRQIPHNRFRSGVERLFTILKPPWYALFKVFF